MSSQLFVYIFSNEDHQPQIVTSIAVPFIVAAPLLPPLVLRRTNP